MAAWQRGVLTMLARLLRYAAVAASVWYLGAYLVVALLRLSYPFDLEWMEGGSVDHVARVLRHLPLYVAPQIAFIPYEYPPLYFYVSASVAHLVGPGYLPLRLVSFVSSIACFVCIYQIVRIESRNAWCGVLAAGLFAATFRIGGAWLDLARVDSLFLALFLIAVLILRRNESDRAHAAAGVVLALSFLTKQTALAMALPICLAVILTRRRAGLYLAGTLLGIVGVSTLLLHRATNGWYTVYVWQYPFKHVWADSVWTTFWTQDVLRPLPIAFAASTLLVFWLIRRRRPDALFWPAAFLGIVGAVYRSRLQTGGYDNVLLPLHAIAAILAALAAGTLLDARDERGTMRVAETPIYIACLAQLALLAYDPSTLVPRAADRQAGERLIATLAALPGDVFVPYHGYLSTAAGKPSHAHFMQVHDILKFGDERSGRLAAQFRAAFRQGAFAAIALDDRTQYYFMSDIDAAYTLKANLFSEPGVLLPVTGGIVSRPEFLYVRKADSAAR